MTPVQSKMARVALDLGIRDLAALAKVAPGTVSRFEAGEELKERTVDALQSALEASGVELIDGTGVRLLYRIIRDGKPDPETKFIRDLEQAKTFALEYVHADPSADVLIELAVGKATWWRYDRELADWVSTSAP